VILRIGPNAAASLQQPSNAHRQSLLFIIRHQTFLVWDDPDLQAFLLSGESQDLQLGCGRIVSKIHLPNYRHVPKCRLSSDEQCPAFSSDAMYQSKRVASVV
jgi:hypothetical protein